MQKIIKVDQGGLWLEDVVIEDDEPIPADCIETPCPDGFYRAKWDGAKWIEIGTAPEETAEQKIKILRSKLAETDYAVIKIAEGVATIEEYADVIVQRQSWRAEINQLENSVD